MGIQTLSSFIKDIKTTLNSFDWTHINSNVMRIKILLGHIKGKEATLDSFDWTHINWYYFWFYV